MASDLRVKKQLKDFHCTLFDFPGGTKYSSMEAFALVIRTYGTNVTE